MRQWGDWALGDLERFVTPWWQDKYNALLQEFGTVVPDDFLVRLWYHGGFFMDDYEVMNEELKVCTDHFGSFVTSLIPEPDLPRVVRRRTAFDPTTVHHLYHLARWEQETETDIRKVQSIVEWGGGYGSTARICLLRNPDLSYRIVDLPLVSVIAATYLDICGLEGRVQMFEPSEATRFWEPDLFISTWALDESTRFAQGFAAAAFNDAPHWLIAHHPDKEIFPDSGALQNILPADLVTVPTPIKHSYYSFR